MRKPTTLTVTALALVMAMAMAAPAWSVEKKANSIGKQVEGFALQDYRGKWHSLEDYSSSKCMVVAFFGTECPLARLYGRRLQALADEYQDRGVTFVGIDSNQQDSITEIANFARVYAVRFPLLKDAGNVVADQFGAERTPQVFVLDAKHTIRYAGRVDDQYGLDESSAGYAKTKTRARHLANAVNEILAGKPVTTPLTEAPGCIIGRIRVANEDSEITYANQISRIFQKHCVDCHREGQIAPFALEDYDEVVGWAEMIEEVVREQRMPPWHADPRYGHFINDRSMSAEEKELIYNWVANGSPLGDPAQLPEPVQYPEGWQLQEPDEVIYMSEEPYTVSADGVVEYQYFIVDPGWTEDKWIKTSECLIDNRSVVHHIFVFAVPPNSKLPTWKGARNQSDGISGGEGGGRLIAGAAPGTPPFSYPNDGMAAFVKAGTRLLFQMHYTPVGREVTDRTAVGFTYADPADVKQNVVMNLAINTGFKIPAGANNHPVESKKTFKEDTLILTFAPHMHLRGKAFRYDLEYADGRVETLLDVPRYDFNWQMIYTVAEPILAPAGSTMRCYARFDNSDENLANPNSTHAVRWGDQTWEEMMIGWFSSSSDIDPSMLDPRHTRTARFVAAAKEKKPRVGNLVRRAAARALDSDEDMDKFQRRIARIVPQVDRVCISSVEDGVVRFLGRAQPLVLKYPLTESEKLFKTPNSSLAKYAAAKEIVVNNDLTMAKADDLLAMGQYVGSSIHIPVTIDGSTVMVNFWSKEKNAFPEQAAEILEGLAGLVGRKK